MAESFLSILSRGVAAPQRQKSIGTAESGFLSRWNWSQTDNFSGKTVTVDSALQLSTVWACVRLIAETISTLPLGFYERQANGSRRYAGEHELYELLHSQPNADMSAVVFWEAVVASMLLWGNAYVRIIRGYRGKIVALDFLRPDAVRVTRRPDGSIAYTYASGTGPEQPIAERDLMHLCAFSLDGITGLSPVSYARQIFGSAQAVEQATSETFRDSSRAAGIVRIDAALNPEHRRQVREHVADVGKNGGVFVLEKGMGYESLKFNPHDAELLASRSFNVEEICRWFRVPPFMVGHSEKSTSWGTGIEQQMLGFAQFVLRPWCVRIEQGIRKSLLTPAEKSRYFAEFALEGLLRADSAGRAALYASAAQNGWMTRNEIRALENWAPVEGGNALTAQSNLLPIDKLGQAMPAPTP